MQPAAAGPRAAAVALKASRVTFCGVLPAAALCCPGFLCTGDEMDCLLSSDVPSEMSSCSPGMLVTWQGPSMVQLLPRAYASESSSTAYVLPPVMWQQMACREGWCACTCVLRRVEEGKDCG
jgi:hypothetical protein